MSRRVRVAPDGLFMDEAEVIDELGWYLEGLELCQECGLPSYNVKKRRCMTAFADETQNIEPLLCTGCAVDYIDYWQAQWDEWAASRGHYVPTFKAGPPDKLKVKNKDEWTRLCAMERVLRSAFTLQARLR